MWMMPLASRRTGTAALSNAVTQLLSYMGGQTVPEFNRVRSGMSDIRAAQAAAAGRIPLVGVDRSQPRSIGFRPSRNCIYATGIDIGSRNGEGRTGGTRRATRG